VRKLRDLFINWVYIDNMIFITVPITFKDPVHVYTNIRLYIVCVFSFLFYSDR
jgi:hypothetical protein